MARQISNNDLKQLAADNFSVESKPVQIYRALDQDEHADKIEISFKEDATHFALSFGTDEPIPYSGLEAPQEIDLYYGDYEFSFWQTVKDLPSIDTLPEINREYYLKASDGETTGVLDWQKALKDFPVLRPLHEPEVRQAMGPLVSVLLRSEKFRNQLKASQDQGILIEWHPDQSVGSYDHKENKLHLGYGDLLALLVVLPHELRHVTQSFPSPDQNVADYVKEKIDREMEANAFAFEVLEELGLRPEPHWGHGRMYQAYKKGDAEFRAAQERTVPSTAPFTYVEEAYFTYQSHYLGPQRPTLVSAAKAEEQLRSYLAYVTDSSLNGSADAETILANLPVDHRNAAVQSLLDEYRNDLIGIIQLFRRFRSDSTIPAGLRTEPQARWEVTKKSNAILFKSIDKANEQAAAQNIKAYAELKQFYH